MGPAFVAPGRGGRGGAFFISRSVDARSQPWRAWAPQHKKQKQSAEARRDFVAKTLQNVRVSMHSGHPSNSATIPSLHRPTRPTRPVDHPTGRPAHHLPPLGPTLGTRPDGPLSPGPPPGAPFFVFCFLRSLAGSNRPTTRAAHLPRDQKHSARGSSTDKAELRTGRFVRGLT